MNSTKKNPIRRQAWLAVTLFALSLTPGFPAIPTCV
jgi:hypothetical protein